MRQISSRMEMIHPTIAWRRYEHSLATLREAARQLFFGRPGKYHVTDVTIVIVLNRISTLIGIFFGIALRYVYFSFFYAFTEDWT